MNTKRLFDIVEHKAEKYYKILEEVCNIESPTSFKEGVDRCGAYFVEFAKEKNWDVEMLSLEKAGNPICITLNSDSIEKPIVFSGHLDTVHPVGLFPTPACNRVGNTLFGPGTTDCKGGVVAALLAMEVLDEVDFRERPVKLILQTDEETGSKTSELKTVDFMIEKSKGAIAFFNLEATSPNNECILTRKSILRYQFNITGKAAHSSKCMNGISAITEAAHKILELEKYKDGDGITCNCGVISGGTVANTVPEKCCFVADFRCPEEEEKNVIEIIEKISGTSYLDGTSCTVEKVSSRPGMPLEERNLLLLKQINEIFSQNGMPVFQYKRGNGGSDAAYITKAGIPCVDNLGVIGINIHSINEQVDLTSILDSAKRMVICAMFL